MSKALYPLLLAALCAPLAPVLALQEPGHDHEHPATEPQAPAATTAPAPVRLNAFGAEGVQLRAGLIGSKFELARTVTLPALLAHLESSGYVQNFALAAGREKGEHRGPIDADIEVYAWVEGASNTLLQNRDAELAQKLATIVDAIAAAQREDGYVGTSLAIGGKSEPWSDLAHGRELYCGARLIEAAVAHRRATNETRLLDVARKFADLVDRSFGPGKRTDPGSDPGIEAALCDLYQATGEARYLTLAKFFVDARGNVSGRTGYGAIAQDDKPVRAQTQFLGDPLRATEFYTGAARVARLLEDAELQHALEAIWADAVATKMNVVGGLGNAAARDGITGPFDLASQTSSWDARAALGLARWSHAMLIATGEAKYADVVDLVLHNAALAAIAPSGIAFAPVGRLSSDGEFEHVGWPACGATGAEIARFLCGAADFLFVTAGNSIYVSQYAPCEGDFQVAGANVHMKLQTTWPLAGLAEVEVQCDKEVTFAIKFRRPGWCKQVFYMHDQKEQEHSKDYPTEGAGWEPYERRYHPMDGCKINLIGPVRREAPLAGVTADKGRVAVCRGPLVYAIESLDNRGHSHALVLPATAKLTAADYAVKVFTSIRAFRSRDAKLVERGADGTPSFRPAEMILIPFFQIGGRGRSSFDVWLAETPDGTRAEGAPPR